MDDEREGPAGKLEDLAGTVKDAADTIKTVAGVAGKVAETASGAYEQSKHYARTAQEEYPEVGRRLRQGGQAVRQHAGKSSRSSSDRSILGYTLAWLVHGQQHFSHQEELPDYARKRM